MLLIFTQIFQEVVLTSVISDILELVFPLYPLNTVSGSNTLCLSLASKKTFFSLSGSSAFVVMY